MDNLIEQVVPKKRDAGYVIRIIIIILIAIAIIYTMVLWFGMKAISNLALICVVLFFALMAYVLFFGGETLKDFAFAMVIGLIAGSVYMDEKDMRAQEKMYIEREATLNREIEEEELRTKTLNERKKYVATNQYIQEVAKEKLGLLNPDEVLIKARED